MRTSLVRGVSLLLVALSCGCSKTSAPASAPVTAPVLAANVPTAVALPSKKLEALDTQLANSDPRFSFFTDGDHSELIFVNIEPERLQVHPGLLMVRRGKYELVELDDERFTQQGWMAGYITPDRKRIWAVSDGIIESPSWELNIVHSADGGVTWRVASTLRKPHYLLGFHSLHMRPDGSGALYLLDEDPLSHASELPPGYFIYKTQDWGTSWSSPQYEPDMLRRPDVAPSEQRAPRQPLSVYLKQSLRKTEEDR